jgi:hypothetical protein
LIEKVVISQSMYFPWVGLLEQVRLADCFIHYNDVQFTRGFYNRVQLKTESGIKWLTVPTRDYHRGQRIDEVQTDESQNWRELHVRAVQDAFRHAPFGDDAVELIKQVLAKDLGTVGDVSRASIEGLVDYFGLAEGTQFLDSKNLGIDGKSTQRLLDLVLTVNGKVYITGHGARNYMDHSLFENKNIDVQYMHYKLVPYPQLHGDFVPYVTGLDLVANCGPQGKQSICSTTIGWKEFISESN